MRRTCQSAIVALLLAPAAHWALAGAVSGKVVLVNSDGTPLKKRDYSGVVVWLDPAGPTSRPASSEPRQAVLDQRNKAFLPHLLAVEVGTAVDFPNSDAIFHNAFSNGDGQIFDVGVYPPKTSRRVVFRRPGMVRVFCNVHEGMSALIAVLPTPYFAVTGTDGSFQIKAPAGSYRLRFWHEQAQVEALSRLERQLALGEAAASLPEILMPQSSAPLPPHKNKYGQEYFQQAEEHILYPGSQRYYAGGRR